MVTALGLVLACSGRPASKEKGAPTTPPDRQFSLGREQGHQVLLWTCVDGAHVVMVRGSSAFFGVGKWTIERSPCGTTTEWDALGKDASEQNYWDER